MKNLLFRGILSTATLLISGVLLANNWVVTNLNDSGPGSLRANALIAGADDTITFQQSLLSGQNDTIHLNSVIQFSQPITIIGLVNGLDSLYISGQSSSQIFNINLSSSTAAVRYARLENLFFADGYALGDGGAVFFEGDSVYVSHCVFINNYSGSHSGGICAHRDNTSGWGLIHLESCYFFGNSGDSGGGAGMYSSGHLKAEVQNCTFINNQTTLAAYEYNGGGALRIWAYDGVITEINDCIFSDNTSVYHGGAVHIYSKNDISTDLSNSIFNNNTAAYYGGALCIYNNEPGDAVLNLDHCTFTNNIGHDGGAIFIQERGGGNTNILMEYTIIAYNTATGAGGGLMAIATWSVGGSDNFADVDIRYSTVHHNTAQEYGGGIAVHVRPQTGAGDEGESNLDIYKSTIVFNSALEKGGGIFNEVSYNNNLLGFPKKCFTTVDKSTIAYNESEIGAGIYNRLYSSTASYTKLFTESSIIALNGDTSIFSFNPTSLITSSGYSIFSDSLINGLAATDTNDVDSLQLLLGPLTNNGGVTMTMTPQTGSIAINTGSPADLSDAQNWPISDGQRDVGSAENACIELVTNAVSVCDSLVSPSENYIWYSTGIYSDTLLNVIGCDSLFVIELTIGGNSAVDVLTECGPYTWIDGNVYTTNNNTATYTLINSSGCDSTVTLNLTIGENSGTDVRTECSPYIWIDGNTYTMSNNTATYTLTNSTGCDSIVLLDLTIQLVNPGVANNDPQLTAYANGASYQWVDCNNAYAPISGATNQVFDATTDGDYAVIITDNGCTDTSACQNISHFGSSSGIYNHEELILNIYPNPTSNKVKIEFAENSVHALRLFSMDGKLIWSETTNESIYAFELNQAKGIYFLEVTREDRTDTFEIIVE